MDIEFDLANLQLHPFERLSRRCRMTDAELREFDGWLSSVRPPFQASPLDGREAEIMRRDPVRKFANFD